MSELTQAQRAEMERAFEEEHGAGFVGSSLMSPVIIQEFEAGFLAGLRYQDEPSEAEVEAAARAMWDRPRSGPFSNEPPSMKEERDGGTQWRSQIPLARAALKAAREVRGDADS